MPRRIEITIPSEDPRRPPPPPFPSMRSAAQWLGVSHVAMYKAYRKGPEYFEEWMMKHLDNMAHR